MRYFIKMHNYNDLSVNKVPFELLLGMFQFASNFSKKYKYTAGESQIIFLNSKKNDVRRATKRRKRVAQPANSESLPLFNHFIRC
jgi:hypothetical protein